MTRTFPGDEGGWGARPTPPEREVRGARQLLRTVVLSVALLTGIAAAAPAVSAATGSTTTNTTHASANDHGGNGGNGSADGTSGSGGSGGSSGTTNTGGSSGSSGSSGTSGTGSTGNGNNGNSGHSGDGSPSGNNGNDKCVGNVLNAVAYRTSHARTGHQSSSDGTSSGCASFSVTKAASLSSTGTEITYTITAINSGSLAGSVSVTDAIPSGTTYLSAFGGALESNSLVTWSSGTVAANTSASFTFTVEVGSNVTSVANTASWTGPGCTSTCSTNQVNDYAITFYSNGGSGTMSPQFGSGNVTIASNSFTDPGYTFTGWSTNSNGTGTSYSNGGSIDLTAPVILYAQWSQGATAFFSVAKAASVSGSDINYTITATNSGSIAGVVSVTDGIPSGTSYLSASAGVSESNSLVTWLSGSVGANGGTASFTFTVQVDPGATSVANTASWTGPGCATSCSTNQVNDYAITFNPNGGSGAMSPQFGSGNVTIASNSFTRSGYTFTGWNTSNAGGGTSYSNGGSIYLIAPVTLYAQWTANTGGGGGGGGGGSSGGGGGGKLTPTVSITNMPTNPKTGSGFDPTYATSGDGTIFTLQTATSGYCSISTVNGKTHVTFDKSGTCSLIVTVAATTDYNSATGTATTQAASAVSNKPPTYPLTLIVVGTGGVRSNASTMNLRHAGSVARRFAAKALVTFVATPLPGFVQRWTGACTGTSLQCRVTMTNAKRVRVAFRPAVIMPTFYFATNMSNITMPAAQVAKFRADLVTLVKLHVKTLTIRAYADYRNGPVYNLALSQRRANSVTAFVENLLVQSGLQRMPIKNLGLGILRTYANLQLDRKAVISYI